MFKNKCFCFINLFYCLRSRKDKINKKNMVFDKIEYHPLMLYDEITNNKNNEVKTYIECQSIFY